MSLYFQRERKNLTNSIAADGIVLFDVSLANSETTPLTDPGHPPAIPEPDFAYNEDGTIDIFREANYMVCWQTASVTGMATDGQAFQLKKRDYEAEKLDPLAGEIWIPLGSSAAAFRVSSSTGFSIVKVSTDELDEFAKATIALFNISNNSIKLSRHEHTKAGIIIFGVGAIDADISNLYEYIEELYSFITYSDVHIFNAYSAPFYLGGTNPTPAQQVTLDHSPDPNHYQVGIIWSGNTYNFWLISPSNQRSITINNGTTYYLLRAQDFVDEHGERPLQWYQGQTTYGSIWINDGSYRLLPVMLDNTGIYIQPTSNINGIINIKFTQTLILTPPASNIPSPKP